MSQQLVETSERKGEIERSGFTMKGSNQQRPRGPVRGPGLLDVDGLEEGWERWVTKVVVEIKLFRAAKMQADCEEL